MEKIFRIINVFRVFTILIVFKVGIILTASSYIPESNLELAEKIISIVIVFGLPQLYGIRKNLKSEFWYISKLLKHGIHKTSSC